MSTTSPIRRRLAPVARRSQLQREGLGLLVAIVGLMWLIEVINSVDSYRLDSDGIYPRSLDRLWGIFTAPFLHASWTHLLSNTVPLVFMGVIVALRGARRLALVTLIVIVIGGLGTWLIAPSGSDTIGASGLVFGYATYLLTRGFFDRSVLEVLTGVLVAVLWGGVLLASLVPQPHISWQGHVSGAVGGVVAASLLSARRGRSGPGEAGLPGGRRRALPG